MKLLLIEDIVNQAPVFGRWVKRFSVFFAIVFVTDVIVSTSLLHGLEKYFGLDQPAEVLLIGHSHTVLGIDHIMLCKDLGIPVAKYARQGATLRERLAMIRHFLDRQPDSVKVIVYDVDAHLLNPSGLSQNSYRLFYPFLEEPAIQDYLSDVTGGNLDYQMRRLIKTARYDEVTLALSLRGLLGIWSNFKSGSVDITRLKEQIAAGKSKYRAIQIDAEQLALLEASISEARHRNIKFVLAYYPTIDIYNKIEHEKHRRVIELFESLAADDAGVIFLDFNPEFASQHELFYDPIHMNPEGKHKLTTVLTTKLREILNEKVVDVQDTTDTKLNAI
jgi:hypothetical protein